MEARRDIRHPLNFTNGSADIRSMRDYEMGRGRLAAKRLLYNFLVLASATCLTAFIPRARFLAPPRRAASSYRFSRSRATARGTSRLESYLLPGVSVSLRTSVSFVRGHFLSLAGGAAVRYAKTFQRRKPPARTATAC